MSKIPLGSIVEFVGSEPPTGWEYCKGQALDRRDYSQLFKHLGYAFGGRGWKFNLPTIEGHIIRVGGKEKR